jgi:hypothetical protein
MRHPWAALILAALLVGGCLATNDDRLGTNRDDHSPAPDAPPAAMPSHNSTQ